MEHCSERGERQTLDGLCLSVSAPTSHLSLSWHWRLNTEHSSTELHPSPLIYSVRADLTMALLPLSNWGRTGHCEDSKGPLLTLWLWIRWQLAVHMAWRCRQRSSSIWINVAMHYETWRWRVFSLGNKNRVKRKIRFGTKNITKGPCNPWNGICVYLFFFFINFNMLNCILYILLSWGHPIF